jgi:hypothetical protein
MFVPVPGTTVTHTFDSVALFSPDQNLDTSGAAQFARTSQRSMQTQHDWALEYADQGPVWNDASTYHKGVGIWRRGHE